MPAVCHGSACSPIGGADRRKYALKLFSSKACERLGHYVYLLIDPRDERVFYVGKGRGNRCFSHLKDDGESEKVEMIRALRKLGFEPRIEILKYGLTEPEALLVESTAIDLLDIEKLTNRVRGFGSRHGSRSDRFEFVGQIADDAVRDRYLGRSVTHYFKPGAQNPIMYVYC